MDTSPIFYRLQQIQVIQIFHISIKFGVDAVLLVHTNKRLRIQRMLSRGFSKKSVLEIDNKQLSFQELRHRSDYLIYNSGTEKGLKQKVDRLIEKLHL